MVETTKYQTGDRVKVRADSPVHHFRTPTYIQGKSGRVTALCGTFPNPESLAHGGAGTPHQPLYRVEFRQTEVWSLYPGPSNDKILVDIYEHWLEPAQ
jgi:nitrile hydratase